MPEDPNIAAQEMRRRIYGGARLLLDSLSDEELAAVQPLLLEVPVIPVIPLETRTAIKTRSPDWVQIFHEFHSTERSPLCSHRQ